MKISLYTFVKNGIYFDYHVEAMLRYHVKQFDEVVVVEGFSNDGTFEAIKDIPGIRILRSQLGDACDISWYVRGKDAARAACTGDWCVLLDCDELMPDWELRRLRETIEKTEQDILGVRPLHFYGSYKTHILPRYAKHGFRIHRNLPDVEVWGDGMNVRRRSVNLPPVEMDVAFEIHHFGEVRRAARLREKWRAQSRMYKSDARKDWVPRFVYKLMPHQWFDSDILPRVRIYEGPYVSAVLENPDEFVRDGFKVYRWAQRMQERGLAQCEVGLPSNADSEATGSDGGQ
jgi:glycosyltransferase involved in cell wall biosynthesis